MLVIILTQSNGGPSSIIRGISTVGLMALRLSPGEDPFKPGDEMGSLPRRSNAYRSTKPRVYHLLESRNKEQNKVVKESSYHTYV